MSHQEALAAMKTQLLALSTQFLATRKKQQHFLEMVLETQPEGGEPNGGEDYCDKLQTYYGSPKKTGFQDQLFSFLNACNNAGDARTAVFGKSIFFEKINSSGNNANDLLYYVKDCTVAGVVIAQNVLGGLRGTFSIFLTVSGNENVLEWYIYADMNISKKGTFIKRGTSQTQPVGKKLSISLKTPVDAYVTEVRLVNSADKSVMASQKLGDIPTGGKEYTWDETTYPQCSLTHKKNRYRFFDGVYFLDEPVKYQVYIEILEGSKISRLPEFELSHEHDGVVFTIQKPKIKHDVLIKATNNTIINYCVDRGADERKLSAPYSLNGCIATYRDLAGKPPKTYEFGLKVEQGVQPVAGSVVTVNKTSRTGYVNLMVDFSAIQAGSYDSDSLISDINAHITNLRTLYNSISIKLLGEGLENLALAVEDGDNAAIETAKNLVDVIDSAKGVLEGATTSFVFMTQFAGAIPVIGAVVGASKLLLLFLENSKKDEYIKNVKKVLAQLDSYHAEIGDQIAQLEQKNNDKDIREALSKLADPCVPQSITKKMINNEFQALENCLKQSPYLTSRLNKK